MRDTLLALFAPRTQAVQFAIKTVLGGLLALWLAMRLGLEEPSWSLMTAFIVAQPLSGMVVQKGLARLVGTLIGTSVSVVFIALFAQTPWLFLGALGLWLALCTAAATMLRSAWSYSFLLSGYTVAIIALPAISVPLTVFDQAVARSTEISLGIVCATLVSAILWPQRVEHQLAQQAQVAWQSGINAARLALNGEVHARRGLLEVLGRLVAVDSQREHAWFEGNRGRQRAAALRVLSRDLLGVLRLARGVARQWRQLSAEQADALQTWRSQVSEVLQQTQVEQFQVLAEKLSKEALEPHWSAEQQFCLERLALLMHRVQTASESLHAVEVGVAPDDAPEPLSWHRDWQTSAVYGARSALAFLLLSAFWIATAWTAASGALLLCAVVCSLFASRDNAAQIGMMFLRGILLAIPVAFVAGELLLPQVTGFPMLCIVMGAPLFFGALGMANPKIGATATSFCLHFIVLISPQNSMTYDVDYFLNSALAMLIGVGFAVLAFNLVTLRNPVWHGQRLLKAIRADLARLTNRRLVDAENWFGGRMADRLLQLARHYPALPDATRSRWDDGVASLDLGDELIHLRGCLAAAGSGLEAVESDFMACLEEFLLDGPNNGREDALEQAGERLLAAIRSQPSRIELRLAQAALLQLRGGWRHWRAIQGEAYGVA
ncbi:fusaric acid resistance protein [Pseudomonas sp. J237]|nr:MULTISPECIES: FUSC family protein [Pseudomonas]OEO23864.1 fusaric acid resistance protein [Pseudomonas sp. J237]